MLTFLRDVMIKNYTGDDIDLISISSPKVLDYELQVLDAYRLILEKVKLMRFRSCTSVAEDEKKYAASNDYCEKTALLYRIVNKTILQNQLSYVSILTHILQKVMQSGIKQFKEAYLEVFEGEDRGRVMKNRLALRTYLQELHMHLKRVANVADRKLAKVAPKKKAKVVVKK